MTSRFIIAAATAAILAVAGCGKTTINVDSETALVKKGLDHVHLTAKSIDCPSGVEAKVGNTLNCTAKLTNGHTATFTLKVDKVTGSSGHMTIVAAKEH